MEQIRNYRIVRELGKGGMGLVYKALDPASQKHVALKVLPPNLVDRSTVERFQREAQAMSRLNHPNLVKVFEVGMERGKHFFTMEFIEGDNLRVLIKQRGRFPEKEALSIMRQVASALEYIHKEGVIHRDI